MLKKFIESLKKVFKKEEKQEVIKDEFWLDLERLEEAEKEGYRWTKLKISVLVIEIIIVIYFILAVLGKVPYF